MKIRGILFLLLAGACVFKLGQDVIIRKDKIIPDQWLVYDKKDKFKGTLRKDVIMKDTWRFYPYRRKDKSWIDGIKKK